MVSVSQIRFAWSGIPGLPGVTTVYTQGDEAVVIGRFKTFFEAMKTEFPTGTRIVYPITGTKIDLASGQASGSWTAVGTGDTVCTGSGTYQAPTGAVGTLKTGFYVNGRELRGRLFMVPLVNGATSAGGRLAAGNAALYQTRLAAACIPTGTGDSPVSIYSRKWNVVAPVTAVRVPDMVAVLRSRRD